MGLFASLSDAFNEGRNQAHKETCIARENRQKTSIPIQLVQPSIGKVVELQVTEKNNWSAKLYMRNLKAYASTLKEFGVASKVTLNTVRLTFPNLEMADEARKLWSK